MVKSYLKKSFSTARRREILKLDINRDDIAVYRYKKETNLVLGGFEPMTERHKGVKFKNNVFFERLKKNSQFI